MAETIVALDERTERAEAGTNYFLRALAACGDHDAEDVDLIEQYLAIEAKLRREQQGIAALMTGRDRDQYFQQRCRDASEARADLAAFQIRELLEGWAPGFIRSEFPN